jgi:hypothetical protein
MAVDLKKILRKTIIKATYEDPMRVVGMIAEKDLIIDDKPLSNKERDAVIAFVRFLRSK